jgi:hypothetical protein
MNISDDSTIRLPITGTEHDGERASRRALSQILEPTFNIRLETNIDLGVDGTIEVGKYDATTGKRIWTNLRAYFQIKHTSTPRYLSDGSLSFSIEIKNLNYLNSRQLPALYFIFDFAADTLYMRWHRHIVQEFEVTNPTWATQKTVDVHFDQVVTEDALTGIEAEIRAHVEIVSLLDDGPGFVRNFSGERLPDGLYAHYPFVGRQEQISALEMQVRPNNITVVWGVSGAGKTELVAHLLSNREATIRIGKTLPKPLALLLVDLKPQIGLHSVFRNLAYALGVSKLSALTEVDWDGVASETHVNSILVSQALRDRLRGQSVLAVFENSQNTLQRDVPLRELDQILSSDVFRDGAAILISYNDTLVTGQNNRILKPSLHLENLSPDEAEILLSNIIGDSGLTKGAMDIIRTIPEVLLPGGIIRGIGSFDRRVANYESRSAELLAEAIVYGNEPSVKEFIAEIGSREATSISEVTGFYSLAALALFRSLSMTPELLLKTNLALPPLHEKWLAKNAYGYQLTDHAEFLVRNEIRIVFNEVRREDVRVLLRANLSRFVDALERETLPDERSQRAVEDALSSIKQLAPHEVGLQDRLSKLLLPYIADDLIFPFSKTESAELKERLQETDSRELESQVAQLVAASRFEIDSVEILKQLRQTVEIAATSDQLASHHVRALDITALILARNYNLDAEIVKIRQQLITRLFLKAHKDNYRDTAWSKWASSWGLNTAELFVRLGHLSSVDRLLEDVAGLLGSLPSLGSQQAILDVNQLWHRLKRLEAKLAKNQTERVSKLREALWFAAECIAFSTNQEHSIRLYLRAIRNLIDELRGDAERTTQVDEALKEVVGLYGDHLQWPLYIASASAALIRHEASLHTNPERRLERAEVALTFLSSFEMTVLSFAIQGDSRPLLTLARCHAFLASSYEQAGRVSDSLKSFKKAKELTKKAVENSPTTKSWILLLELQDKEDHSSLENFSNVIALPPRSVSATLRKLMKKGLAWAHAGLNQGLNEGILVLWCLKREWTELGSLERHAANFADLDKSWSSLNRTRKIEIVTEIYDERVQRLDHIARRFGVFRDLFLARVTNEVQYQRFIALQSTHKFDMVAVLTILESAAIIWPNDALIVVEKALLYRLVWDYANAITYFRRVRTMSADGELRRQVTVNLIETLLSASIHKDVLQFSDGINAISSELVSEAQSLLPEIVEFRNVAMEASVLRDRVHFEAGTAIDWSAIDSAYELVIGGVDRYLDTVLRNLDELLLERPHLPKDLAEVVKQNCTSTEVLHGMGSLYLRRAETGRGDTPLQDCERAYAAFNACRILERSWFDHELPLTTFRRARTILIAAQKCNDPNPFPVYLGKRKTALDLAGSLLQSVISRSVGGFHEVALQRSEDLRALRNQFKDRSRLKN